MRLLNLKENELDGVADFMGHEVSVHKDTYRLANETFEISQMSALCLAMERGEFLKPENKDVSLKDFVNRYNPEDTSDEENENERYTIFSNTFSFTIEYLIM